MKGKQMKKLLLIALVAGGLILAAAPRLDAQVYFSIGFGPGYYPYRHYYPYGSYSYYQPYYGGYYYRPYYWYGGHRYYRHHHHHHHHYYHD